jgi:hypothetical protein
VNEEEEILLSVEEEIETTSDITDNNETQDENDPLFETSCGSCLDSTVYDPYFTGTACCVDNSTELKLNSPVTFKYVTNRDIIDVEWIVNSDNIEVITTNGAFITVQFHDDFTEGFIQGNGVHATYGVICGTRVELAYNHES